MKPKQKKKWMSGLFLSLLICSVGCVKEPDISTLQVKETVSPTPILEKEQSPIKLIDGADGELTIAGIEQGRDLQLYDQGGHCYCGSYAERPEEEIKRKAEFSNARQFIWEHWRDKKRGYIRLTFSGIDAATTTHFFIEPEPGNKWVINRRAINGHALMPARLMDLEKIFQVHQKREKDQQQTLIFENSEGIKIDTL
ncbi:MAG: hypothetical protein ACKVZH_22825 [Blastocatellia bacterium]